MDTTINILFGYQVMKSNFINSFNNIPILVNELRTSRESSTETASLPSLSAHVEMFPYSPISPAPVRIIEEDGEERCCSRFVLGTYLVRISVLIDVSPGFFQSFQTTARIVTLIEQQPPSSNSLPIQHSLVSFDGI
jgi:hypothetical protein